MDVLCGNCKKEIFYPEKYKMTILKRLKVEDCETIINNPDYTFIQNTCITCDANAKSYGGKLLKKKKYTIH